MPASADYSMKYQSYKFFLKFNDLLTIVLHRLRLTGAADDVVSV